MSTETYENNLQPVHRQWALWTTQQFRLAHPELDLTLCGGPWSFTIHVGNCESELFPALSDYFDNSVRPVTCDIKLSLYPPHEASVYIEDPNDYHAELWLNGEPTNVATLNAVLALAEPKLPAGGIDFDRLKGGWVFRTYVQLSEADIACVQRAAQKAGIIGQVYVDVVTSPPV